MVNVKKKIKTTEIKCDSDKATCRYSCLTCAYSKVSLKLDSHKHVSMN